MSREWIVLDTNIWIFGLRNHPEFPACAKLLLNLPKLKVKIPKQILQELQDNLSVDEFNEFFELNQYLTNLTLTWQGVDHHLITKYLNKGCKYGDAEISAYLEDSNSKTLVSENRDFLFEIEGLPFRVLISTEAINEFLS